MFPLECSKKKKCRLCVNPGNDLSQIILLSCQEKVTQTASYILQRMFYLDLLSFISL